MVKKLQKTEGKNKRLTKDINDNGFYGGREHKSIQ